MHFDPHLYCVALRGTVREAVACIDRNSAKIALVVDDDGRLLDTITDGDIRRAILDGLAFESPLAGLREAKQRRHNRAPLTAPLGTDEAAMELLMREKSVNQLPLLDDAGRVAGLVTMRHLARKHHLPLHAIIMAGGQGVRLRPLTNDTPKPMLPVGDRPLLELTIDRLREAGIRRISIITHYMGETIENHFGDGEKFGVRIDYIVEEEPRGTAGALSLVPAGTEPLLLLNGDILTRVDFASMLDFHRDHASDITLGVREYDFRVPYGVVETEGIRVKKISEKPVVRHFVNAGIYLLQPEMCALVPKNQTYDMPSLINDCAAKGRAVVSFPVREYWLDIGQIEDYHKAVSDVNEGAA